MEIMEMEKNLNEAINYVCNNKFRNNNLKFRIETSKTKNSVRVYVIENSKIIRKENFE